LEKGIAGLAEGGDFGTFQRNSESLKNAEGWHSIAPRFQSATHTVAEKDMFELTDYTKAFSDDLNLERTPDRS